jgi:hypothetical protein
MMVEVRESNGEVLKDNGKVGIVEVEGERVRK